MVLEPGPLFLCSAVLGGEVLGRAACFARAGAVLLPDESVKEEESEVPAFLSPAVLLVVAAAVPRNFFFLRGLGESFMAEVLLKCRCWCQ